MTATTLTQDDRLIYSVAKDGTILQHDIETSKKTVFSHSSRHQHNPATTNDGATADWIRRPARQSGRRSLLAATVSHDGRYLAVGGGSKSIDVYDTRTKSLQRSFPGHKDAVTALCFRQGTYQLYSGSLDRSIKIWDVADWSYVDTLFGHQAEVLAVDALRAERVVSCGADRTCRVWKIPEESQLVFRGYCPTIEDCAYINGSEWVSGSADGSVQLWNNTRKKPVCSIRDAHCVSTMSVDSKSIESGHGVTSHAEYAAVGAGSVGGDAATWVNSVAVCKGSDLVASGSGDGVVRLWAIKESEDTGRKYLEQVGGLAVRGFVNSLHIARSARFLVAGVGQEQRMGRWVRDGKARNGVVVHELHVHDDDDE